MNGSARSSSERKNDCSGLGVSGRMNVSVTVYSSKNVPTNATVFSNTYSGRILTHQHNDISLSPSRPKNIYPAMSPTYRSVRGYSSS